MRKLLCLIAVLAIAIAVPLTAAPAAGASHTAPGLASAPGGHLLCVPPACDGPLCYPPRGCPYCCHG